VTARKKTKKKVRRRCPRSFLGRNVRRAHYDCASYPAAAYTVATCEAMVGGVSVDTLVLMVVSLTSSIVPSLPARATCTTAEKRKRMEDCNNEFSEFVKTRLKSRTDFRNTRNFPQRASANSVSLEIAYFQHQLALHNLAVGCRLKLLHDLLLCRYGNNAPVSINMTLNSFLDFGIVINS
jgi:hypothetical protein